MQKLDSRQKEVRKMLSTQAQEDFDDIVFSRKLGANRHIKMIGNMIIDIANSDISKDLMLENIGQLTNYFKETRGNQSRAVFNGITAMEGFKNKVKNLNKEKTVKEINSYIENFSNNSKKHVSKIIKYANNISRDFDNILLFDYSSTLNEYILNSDKGINFYIPESRALNGGRPYLDACIKNGNKTYFLPDTLIFDSLKKCDAAFIGAESFYADGTAFNTIGSKLVALACEYLKVPLYILTPLIKLDERQMHGIEKLSPMPYDYSRVLQDSKDKNNHININSEGIKLTKIEPDFITHYITEVGLVPPKALYGVSEAYLNKIGGSKNE